MRKVISKISQRGSMMVEALAMLGLITMVTPVLYKKAAERTTELQDINTATQLRSLSKALDEYIADNYEDLSLNVAANSSAAIDKDDIVPYLPYSFNVDDSKLFDEYQFAVRHEVINPGADTEHSALTGAVLGNLSSDLPKIRSAKIASMVGANGGVVEDANIMGVQGGWEATLNEFGFSGDAANGSLVSMSTHAVTASGDGASAKHVLYRDDSKGVEYNTMQTALFMGENPIEEVTEIIAANDAVDITGGLDVSGLVTAPNATISGNLIAGTGTINNLLKAGSAEITGKLSAVAGGFVADTSGVTITKPTTINSTATITGKVTASGGADITGPVNITGDTKITGKTDITGDTKITGKAEVTGEMKVGGNFNVTGDITAPNITGTNSVSAGEGNFVADKTSVKVTKANINLAEKVKITDTAITATPGTGTLTLNNSGMDYTSGNNKLALTAAGAASLSTTQKIDMTSPDINIGVSGTTTNLDLVAANIKATASSTASVELTGSKFQAKIGSGNIYVSGSEVNIENPTKVKLSQGDANKIEMASSKITVDSDNLYVDGTDFKYLSSLHMTKDDIVFNTPATDNQNVDNAPAIPTDNSVLSSGVRIKRAGMIHLPTASATADKLAASAGQQDTAGYSKLDRVIANRAFDDVYTGAQLNKSGATASNPYDAYQVNPAYTSVMHDIKLTTRGGARLSDILPDFINKGIYVLDNTYEEKSTPDWSTMTANSASAAQDLAIGTGRTSCTNVNCVASPWLGFVPTPQCPPGYAKVITINPIRWKMSEAFYVPGITGLTSDPDSFRKYFVPRTNPLNAEFKIYKANGSSGEHTHVVESGWPLTFQTNTWLNTTISAVKSGSNFWGWHAIMGFLYYGADYEEYLSQVGNTSNLSDKVVWNLFPVYNEELTAIANVYCFFDRRTGEWNSNLVDTTYDQITKFRAEHDKTTSGYSGRLNDPALSYDEAW